jgi:pimeloyl-ACP methyl ester carboxylesterase
MRGYAPTAVPADGAYQLGALVADVVALHGARDGCIGLARGTERLLAPSSRMVVIDDAGHFRAGSPVNGAGRTGCADCG